MDATLLREKETNEYPEVAANVPNEITKEHVTAEEKIVERNFRLFIAKRRSKRLSHVELMDKVDKDNEKINELKQKEHLMKMTLASQQKAVITEKPETAAAVEPAKADEEEAGKDIGDDIFDKVFSLIKAGDNAKKQWYLSRHKAQHDVQFGPLPLNFPFVPLFTLHNFTSQLPQGHHRVIIIPSKHEDGDVPQNGSQHIPQGVQSPRPKPLFPGQSNAPLTPQVPRVMIRVRQPFPQYRLHQPQLIRVPFIRERHEQAPLESSEDDDEFLDLFLPRSPILPLLERRAKPMMNGQPIVRVVPRAVSRWQPHVPVQAPLAVPLPVHVVPSQSQPQPQSRPQPKHVHFETPADSQIIPERPAAPIRSDQFTDPKPVAVVGEQVSVVESVTVDPEVVNGATNKTDKISALKKVRDTAGSMFDSFLDLFDKK